MGFGGCHLPLGRVLRYPLESKTRHGQSNVNGCRWFASPSNFRANFRLKGLITEGANGVSDTNGNYHELSIRRCLVYGRFIWVILGVNDQTIGPNICGVRSILETFVIVDISMAIPGSDSLEVPIPYIFGLFFRPKFQGISPENMANNMVLTYLQF